MIVQCVIYQVKGYYVDKQCQFWLEYLQWLGLDILVCVVNYYVLFGGWCGYIEVKERYFCDVQYYMVDIQCCQYQQ